jgi:hypothetical protein
MARLTITFEDDERGGVQVTTTNDTPTADPAKWTPAHHAFYAASAALEPAPARDLVIDGEAADDGEASS